VNANKRNLDIFDTAKHSSESQNEVCSHWLGIRETTILKQVRFAYCPKCGEKL